MPCCFSGLALKIQGVDFYFKSLVWYTYGELILWSSFGCSLFGPGRRMTKKSADFLAVSWGEQSIRAEGEMAMVHGMLANYKFGTFTPHPDFNTNITLFVIFVVLTGAAALTAFTIVKSFEK